MLVSVYDVSRSAGQLVHMNNLPYCLFPDGVGPSCIGSVSLEHPQNSNENVCLFRLSDEGSLHYVDLAIPGLSEDSVVNTSWSADVKELDAQMQYLCPDVGPLGAKDFSETDFRLPYDGGCSSMHWLFFLVYIAFKPYSVSMWKNSPMSKRKTGKPCTIFLIKFRISGKI